MMRVLIGLIVLWLLATACRTMPVAGECPESASLRCMTRKICQEDAKRGCVVCTCESAWESDPARQEDRQRGRVPE